MVEIFQFALIGLGLGALYSLASQGLVLIYRGSGVLNFAHGGIGMIGAYVYYEARVTLELPFIVAVLIGVAFSALVGALTQILVMRHLKHASPLARVVTTLGILLILQSLAVLRYGGRVILVPPELPQGRIVLPGDITMQFDRIIMLAIAVIFTIILYLVYRYSAFGLSTSAVAENELAAGTVGISAEKIATVNWAVGSAMGGFAAILVAPIVTLQVSVMTNIVLAALAAALIAGFRSFPIALIAGLLLGVVQTVVGRYTGELPGVAESVPFIAIILVLVFRGNSLPLRDFVLQKLPTLGSGRLRADIFIPVAVVAALLILWVPSSWADAFTMTLGVAIVLLSIVLLTGYAGQLSLGQFALAGFGAWVAGRSMAIWDLPFEAGFLLGVILAVPMGMLFALPAVRTRGISLAVVTLGLGTALELLVFNNSFLIGGFNGTYIPSLTLFGIDISAVRHPERYGIFALVLFVVLAVVLSNVRRGRSGRKLIAVRTNERAAAALGINVVSAKLYAFGAAAAVAAAGGIVLAFRHENLVFNHLFTSEQSISATGWGMIGGIGYLIGPIFGATLAPGSIGAALLGAIPGSFSTYLPLLSGVLIVVFMMMNQNGVAHEMIATFKGLLPKLAKGRTVKGVSLERDTSKPVKVEPKTLEVRNATVKYGTTVAVSDLSFTVEPGKVLGLIGPNGAGKTSIIDAVTGFTRVSSGDALLNGVSIRGTDATRRSRMGIGRSFQALELFEDCTVRDNLLTASDPIENGSFFTEIFRAKKPIYPSALIEAIHEFQLEEYLDTLVQDLPYGRRRLVALARAVAQQPSVLLLDEPAAGLGDAQSAELADLVKKLATYWGIGVLLVEHDMNFVMKTCDSIVVVDFGKKIAEGTPHEIQQNELVHAAYLGSEIDESAEQGQVQEKQ